MKKCTILICFAIFFIAGCKTNDIQNEQPESVEEKAEEQNEEQDKKLNENQDEVKVEETTKKESVNYSKISEAFNTYCAEKNLSIQNFSPCEDLDCYFEKSDMRDIQKVSITDINECEILNAEKKDIVLHMNVEFKLSAWTYIIPFVYSDNAYQLNEQAIITCTVLLNYTFIDIDGDAQNEILADFIRTHNGTDHIILILKCDTGKEARELFFKSFDDFTHELKYGFAEEIPKKFWIKDTKTYINQDKKKKVAKKIKYLYVLKDGKYKKKKKKIYKKSDMKDFYQWTLG